VGLVLIPLLTPAIAAAVGMCVLPDKAVPTVHALVPPEKHYAMGLVLTLVLTLTIAAAAGMCAHNLRRSVVVVYVFVIVIAIVIIQILVTRAPVLVEHVHTPLDHALQVIHVQLPLTIAIMAVRRMAVRMINVTQNVQLSQAYQVTVHLFANMILFAHVRILRAGSQFLVIVLRSTTWNVWAVNQTVNLVNYG
jgi:hypothetical protein